MTMRTEVGDQGGPGPGTMLERNGDHSRLKRTTTMIMRLEDRGK